MQTTSIYFTAPVTGETPGGAAVVQAPEHVLVRTPSGVVVAPSELTVAPRCASPAGTVRPAALPAGSRAAVRIPARMVAVDEQSATVELANGTVAARFGSHVFRPAQVVVPVWMTQPR